MPEAIAPDPGQGAAPASPSTTATLLTGAPLPPPVAPVLTGDPQPPAAGTPPAAPAPAIPWLPTADEATVGYLQNKGWADPAQVVDGYRNLEKLLGADRAGNTVILPKADATPAELDAYFNRLGRPAEPAGYGLDKMEGADPEFAKAAQTWLHKHGVSQKAGEGIAAEWNAHIKAQSEAQVAKAQQEFQADDVALRAQWGGAFVQELAKAQAAVRALGIPEEAIDQLQKSMGHKATMELFHKLGSKMGEPDFAVGTADKTFGNALTPAQAKDTIRQKMADKTFRTQYQAKDVAAVAEMERLHRFAYPE